MTRREGGRVVIELSEDEWRQLRLALGYACLESAREDTSKGFAKMIRLTNSIIEYPYDEGNPHWTPYAVPE
jgi:hypothetical protein